MRGPERGHEEANDPTRCSSAGRAPYLSRGVLALITTQASQAGAPAGKKTANPGNLSPHNATQSSFLSPRNESLDPHNATW